MTKEKNILYEKLKKDPEKRSWTPSNYNGDYVKPNLKELTDLRLIDYINDARSYIEKTDLFYESITFSSLDDWIEHRKLTNLKAERKEALENELLSSNLNTNQSNIETNKFNRRFTLWNIVITIVNLFFFIYQIFIKNS